MEKKHGSRRTIEKKCHVEGCRNKVLEGNHFLCKYHYFHRETTLEKFKLNVRGLIRRSVLLER